jgi:hypothetical protein
MVNTHAGLGTSLSFPTVPQEPELQTNDLIYRILDCKDDLATALKALQDSYNGTLPGIPFRDGGP